MKHHTPSHPLRLLTLLLWIPAFAFLLPYGILTEELCPTLAIAPMTFSAALATLHLAGKAKSRPANILADLFVALFLLGALIPGWVSMASVHGGGVHAYCFFRELYYACRAPTKTCPHCHGSLGRTPKRSVYASVPGDNDDVAVPEMAEEGDSNESKESFHSSQGRIVLADEEPRPSSSKSPRPSTDDETARLV
ncbi:hypothetical protein LTR91_006103 [Friedmanniomyces endolithicus]|uniref:Uncharacterized protein n=1 Tax=Friedmanniomyces endolithicus TaxID=329885 RepID=A0AAN6KTU5_9PEZI|nr:hypothetical protein LTS09_006068 [Friedmanniomyces endolithicus]KAK0277472.1 hypothetical protein LTR35_009874 [Friedmanniomyces endolithicus]KAK0283204.1 hypothetical protein LTS00_011808 [Friedmanniomyces endolithicus]KAK0311226.1 hypothetical protein LTR01_003221 [Friedmanniomyces endolithicus]KAK0320040.1 hypothetical protein LTR82_008975 [Friedmanniomyces endolithicus]